MGSLACCEDINTVKVSTIFSGTQRCLNDVPLSDRQGVYKSSFCSVRQHNSRHPEAISHLIKGCLCLSDD